MSFSFSLLCITKSILSISHIAFIRNKMNLLYNSYYNFKKEVFIAGSDHQWVWCPEVLQDVAHIARDS